MEAADADSPPLLQLLDVLLPNLDTAPVYGQLGVDSSGHGAVVSEAEAARHLDGAEAGQCGGMRRRLLLVAGNESDRCFSAELIVCDALLVIDFVRTIVSL